MNCLKCDQPIIADDRFCGHCGQPFDSALAAALYAGYIVPLAAVGAVVICCILLGMVFGLVADAGAQH